MSYLLDTSVLGRLANVADVSYPDAVRAVLQLNLGGETLHLTAQNLIEFRNFATRPVAHNGLGLTPFQVEAKAALFESTYPLLPEVPAIFPTWKTLVQALAVTGKQVHDVRLVAVCHVYQVTHLLTFNTAHFVRFASFGPGVVVVDPTTV
jgi:predicted nucleic acid-binding protein